MGGCGRFYSEELVWSLLDVSIAGMANKLRLTRPVFPGPGSGESPETALGDVLELRSIVQPAGLAIVIFVAANESLTIALGVPWDGFPFETPCWIYDVDTFTGRVLWLWTCWVTILIRPVAPLTDHPNRRNPPPQPNPTTIPDEDFRTVEMESCLVSDEGAGDAQDRPVRPAYFPRCQRCEIWGERRVISRCWHNVNTTLTICPLRDLTLILQVNYALFIEPDESS